MRRLNQSVVMEACVSPAPLRPLCREHGEQRKAKEGKSQDGTVGGRGHRRQAGTGGEPGDQASLGRPGWVARAEVKPLRKLVKHEKI